MDMIKNVAKFPKYILLNIIKIEKLFHKIKIST